LPVSARVCTCPRAIASSSFVGITREAIPLWWLSIAVPVGQMQIPVLFLVQGDAQMVHVAQDISRIFQAFSPISRP